MAIIAITTSLYTTADLLVKIKINIRNYPMFLTLLAFMAKKSGERSRAIVDSLVECLQDQIDKKGKKMQQREQLRSYTQVDRTSYHH